MSLFNITLWLSITLVLVTSTSAEERKTYSGFSVYRISAQTDEQLESLKELQTSELKEEGKIEFWKQSSTLNDTTDIMVSPEVESEIRTYLRVSRVPFRKVVHDLDEVIRRTSKPRYGSLRDGKNLTRIEDFLDPKVFYLGYQTFSVIEAKLKALAASDSRVELEEVGRSSEKRPLYLVRVSSQPKANKSIIFIDAGHHAREWASHATILYVLENLLGNALPTSSRFATSDSGLSGLLEKYDFWMMPVINPDGYEFSHRTARYWRKTRSMTNSSCIGVDPNRNYPFMWRYGTYECADDYSGPKPFSEPETQALANVLLTPQRKISMYLSLHSYGGYILTPYGYDRVNPENMDELTRVARAGAYAIRSIRGTRYRVGTAAILLYPAPGGSDDFAYDNANIKLSYTIELASNREFTMYPREIVPTGEEIASGIAAMIKAI